MTVFRSNKYDKPTIVRRSSDSDTNMKSAIIELKIDNKDVPKVAIEAFMLDQKLGNHHSFIIELRRKPELESAFGTTMEANIQAWLSKTISIKITSGDKSANDNGEVKFIGTITSVDFESSVTSLGIIRIRGFSPTIMMDIVAMHRIFHDLSSADIIQNLINDEGLPNANVTVSGGITHPGLLAYGESAYQMLNYLASLEGWWAYYDGLNFNVVKDFPNSNIELKANQLGSFAVELDAARKKEYALRSFEFLKGSWFQSSNPSPTASGMPLGKTAGSAAPISNSKEKIILPINLNSQKQADQSVETTFRQTYARLLHAVGSTDRIGVVPGKSLKLKWEVAHKQTESRSEESLSGVYLIVGAKHSYADGKYYCDFTCVARDLAYPYYDIFEFPEQIIEIGTVTDNNDPENLGRIKVRFDWATNDDSQSPFLRLCSPHAGGTPHGLWFIPEINDRVAVSIRGRHLENAMAIGSVNDGSQKPRSDLPGPDNNNKSILTKAGNEIIFKDDNSKEQIIIKAKGGQCQMTYDAASGKENIKIDVKDAATISLDGQGKIDIQTSSSSCKISMDANVPGITLESAQGSIDLKAMNINIEGSAGIKLKSNGPISEEAAANYTIQGAMVEVKGGLIKLN
jgi:type VI secretion system secreted protein VgrG